LVLGKPSDASELSSKPKIAGINPGDEFSKSFRFGDDGVGEGVVLRVTGK
jgi:hypothetical protein